MDIFDVLELSPMYTGNPLMATLANSEDPDEMQHNAAFHQSALFAKIKTTFRNRNAPYFKKYYL